jgi:hypothetical protein
MSCRFVGWTRTAIGSRPGAIWVRFGLRLDGFPIPPDLLSSGTIATMTTGSSGNSSYAEGWVVNGVGTRWHAGTLGRLAAHSRSWCGQLVSTSGRAEVCNTRAPGSQLGQELDDLMWKVDAVLSGAEAVPEWHVQQRLGERQRAEAARRAKGFRRRRGTAENRLVSESGGVSECVPANEPLDPDLAFPRPGLCDVVAGLHSHEGVHLDTKGLLDA